jgi:hypothetical protein
MFPSAKTVFAWDDCSDIFGIADSPSLQYEAGDPSNTLRFSLNGVADEAYEIRIIGNNGSTGYSAETTSVTGSGGVLDVSISASDNPNIFREGNFTILIKGPGTNKPNTIGHDSCLLDQYVVRGAKCEQITIYQNRPGEGANDVCFGGVNGGCLNITDDIWIKTKVVTGFSNDPYTDTVIHEVVPGNDEQANSSDGINDLNHGSMSVGTHTLTVRRDEFGLSNPVICETSFTLLVNCSNQADQCVDVEPTLNFMSPLTLGPDIFHLCNQIPEEQDSDRQECLKCAGGAGNTEGVWTAIGCINKNPKEIIGKFIILGLGMGGGITLLSFLAAGFIFSTSQGSPEKIKTAKEMMTTSVVGLLFIIFSTAMLQFIGWSVFKIPGFGGP